MTEVPAHTGLAEGDTETLTGSNALTVMLIALEVAGLPETHVAFEVSKQVITSLFAGIYE